MMFLLLNAVLALIGLLLGREEDHMWFFKSFTVLELLVEGIILYILFLAL